MNDCATILDFMDITTSEIISPLTSEKRFTAKHHEISEFDNVWQTDEDLITEIFRTFNISIYSVTCILGISHGIH